MEESYSGYFHPRNKVCDEIGIIHLDIDLM